MMAFRKCKRWLCRRQHRSVVNCIKNVGFINDNYAPTLNSYAKMTTLTMKYLYSWPELKEIK